MHPSTARWRLHPRDLPMVCLLPLRWVENVSDRIAAALAWDCCNRRAELGGQDPIFLRRLRINFDRPMTVREEARRGPNQIRVDVVQPIKTPAPYGVPL